MVSAGAKWRDYLLFHECRRMEKSLSGENPRVGKATQGTSAVTAGGGAEGAPSPWVGRGDAEAHSEMGWPEVM